MDQAVPVIASVNWKKRRERLRALRTESLAKKLVESVIPAVRRKPLA